MPTEIFVDQNFEAIRAPEPVKEKTSRRKILLLTAGGFLGLLIILSIIITLGVKKPPLKKNVPFSPSITPTPTIEEIASPSAYSNDPTILNLESNLKSIDKDIQATDMKEVNLNPPALDMKVEFKEKP